MKGCYAEIMQYGGTQNETHTQKPSRLFSSLYPRSTKFRTRAGLCTSGNKFRLWRWCWRTKRAQYSLANETHSQHPSQLRWEKVLHLSILLAPSSVISWQNLSLFSAIIFSTAWLAQTCFDLQWELASCENVRWSIKHLCLRKECRSWETSRNQSHIPQLHNAGSYAKVKSKD